MNVLVACEESQRVCTAFREKGHNAFSCDVIDCSGGHPEWHIKQDVLPLLDGWCSFKTCDNVTHFIDGKWDLIIAHPPCTFLTNTGNCWYNVKKYGDKALRRMCDRGEAIGFFYDFVNADCPRIAIENPVGRMSTYYKKPTQYIQPWQFGDPYTKKTCLWLKGLEPLKPIVTVKPETQSYAWMNIYDENGKCLAWNSKEIKIARSKTFPGIAKAMADQWG